MTYDEAKAEVNKIIRKIVDGDDEYVLDHKYIRWGRVEREIDQLLYNVSKAKESENVCDI